MSCEAFKVDERPGLCKQNDITSRDFVDISLIRCCSTFMQLRSFHPLQQSEANLRPQLYGASVWSQTNAMEGVEFVNTDIPMINNNISVESHSILPFPL